MRIGELAHATGVSVRSLRHYEHQGLIRAERTGGGWRDFDDSMIERVVTIQHLLAAGLCGATISQLLPCLEAEPEQRTGLMQTVINDEIGRLEGKRRELDRELDVLRSRRHDVTRPEPG